MEKILPRRNFIKLGSAATVAAALLPGTGLAVAAKHLPKIALQLYTVRDALEKDFTGTLQRLSKLGIKHVETAFWPKSITVKQAAKALRDAGLTVCSCHADIPAADTKAALLEAAEAYNCRHFIWHGWPEDKRYSTVEGTKELINIYNNAAALAKANGITFGLHNHWWEYRNKVGGRFVYEWLLEGVDKDVFFEIDTYWVKVAGHNPADIIKHFGNRAKFLHMKDGPARWTDSLPVDKPEPMVALGKGTQNIEAIAMAARDNIEWMVIEMDVVATDVFEAIKQSYNYLVQHQYAAG